MALKPIHFISSRFYRLLRYWGDMWRMLINNKRVSQAESSVTNKLRQDGMLFFQDI